MKKTFKKIFSLLLVVIMCFTSAPLQAFVGLDFNVEASSTIETGRCGYGATYTFNPITGELIIDGYGEISENAFRFDNRIRSVTIGGSIYSIEKNAFYSCDSLDCVFIPNYYSAGIEIGETSFAYCTSLRTVVLPPEVKIADKAFLNCTSLKQIYINGANISGYTFKASDTSFEGVNATIRYPLGSTPGYLVNKDFGGALLWEESNNGYCGPNAQWRFISSTKTLAISGSGYISSRSSGNFYAWGCILNDIETVSVGFGIDYIPSYAFEYCGNLLSVSLPQSLKKIDLNAFNDCGKLNNLIIPGSVESFPYAYFNRCNSLTDLYYLGTEEEWSQIENFDKVSIYGTEKPQIHFLVDLSVKPTCQHGGTETYYQFDKTDVYDSLYNEAKRVIYAPINLPATDHSYTKYIPNGDATCTDYGTKTAYCDYECGNSKTIAGDNYKPHDYEETVSPPQCITKGFTTYVCKDCEYTYVDNYVNQLGHDMSEFTVSKKVTCTVDGEEKSICSRCDYYETMVVPALIHEDDNYDGYCEKCDEYIADKNCCCICHSESIFGLVYKILLLVQELTDVDLLSKVFNLGWLCDCNVAHY